mmetsp:Transcript_45790/g.147002  ORF Transcript_45790/g.147002 Transcript_45790/m.147002 type:complete len:206 (+) Transcript_45790:728-1345(+)
MTNSSTPLLLDFMLYTNYQVRRRSPISPVGSKRRTTMPARATAKSPPARRRSRSPSGAPRKTRLSGSVSARRPRHWQSTREALPHLRGAPPHRRGTRWSRDPTRSSFRAGSSTPTLAQASPRSPWSVWAPVWARWRCRCALWSGASRATRRSPARTSSIPRRPCTSNAASACRASASLCTSPTPGGRQRCGSSWSSLRLCLEMLR